jgi:Cu/Ag efflux protein CusF
MRRFTWESIASLAIAGLLTAAPTYGQSGSTGGSSTTGDQTSGTGTGSGTSSGSTMGQSGSSSTGSMGSPQVKSSGTELAGKVQKIDLQSNELTIANSNKTLKLSKDTKIHKDGQKAKISDIKEGDLVRASFSGSGDTLQVKRLDVVSAGPMNPSGDTGSPGSDADTSASPSPMPNQGDTSTPSR